VVAETSAVTWPSVVQELGLAVVPTGQATGVISGLAATVTPLTDDPPSLMGQFRLRVDEDRLAAARPLFEGLSSPALDVSLSNGEARLGFIQLAGQSPQSIRSTLEEFAQALIATGLATPDACVRCGTAAEVQPVFHQGETSLVCGPCLVAATADWHARQTVLDRGSWSAFVGLPAAFTFAAAGWAGFWTLVDLVIGWFHVQVIDVNKFTIFVGLLLVGVVGAALGMPLGGLLRRSGAVRRAPEWLSGLMVVGAAIVGELLYAAVLVFLNVGIVDLGVAAQILPMILQRYHAFWITFKLALAVSIGAFCIAEVRNRPAARLEL
jgi:hypothetical protein